MDNQMPGPWTSMAGIQPKTADIRYIWKVEEEGDGYKTGRMVAIAFSPADAPLIAVAPELLEAAKNSLARYPEQNRLREVVAKAEER